MIAGFAAPDPGEWLVDQATGLAGDAATAGFRGMASGLTTWVTDAAVWVVGSVFSFFFDAADPNVQADWFAGPGGPYATTAGIGATLLVGFVLVGLAQGALSGDIGVMVRQLVMQLPLAVIGITGLVTVVQALVRLTDALSSAVLARFADDARAFTNTFASAVALSGNETAPAFVVFALACLAVIAGIIVMAELVIRAGLIYIVVALSPLVLAAQLWPALRGVARRMLELLVALIVSKLVIAVALAVAAAALAGATSGGDVGALPAPETLAEDPGGSATQAVGILLAAVAAFGIAAFSPLLVAKLMPLTEGALVANGVRGGPLRAGQQAMSLGRSVRGPSGRLSQVAAGHSSTAAKPAIAGPATVATAGASAARTAKTAVERSTSRQTSTRDGSQRAPAVPRPRPAGQTPRPRPPAGG